MTASRRPVALLLGAALLAVVAVVWGTQQLAYRAAAAEAVDDARDRTVLLARAVVDPAIPRGLVDSDPGAIDRFDRKVLRRLRLPDVHRVKIWDADGRIVYSDEPRLIGRRFRLGEDEQEVLRENTSDAELSDLDRPENRFERGRGDLLEVYARVESPERTPLLFELYFSVASITERRDDIVAEFRPIVYGSLGLVVVVATGLLWEVTRRARRAAEERERLLRATVDASDAERVRIARDLHDGVVQDLAGASFTVSALARAERLPADTRAGLVSAGESLRASLRALRSLMVEIYPPDLHAEGLAAALEDLLAPAAARGVTAQARVGDVADASDASVRLVWRVAQEAVRNALRHSGACTVEVAVDRVGDRLVLEVADNGRGFDPQARPERTRFGLRGMNSLIADAGGVLDVRSAPGEGTTVRLEVGAR